MRLVKARREDFDTIYAEMEKNFILDERRDKEDAEKLFDKSEYVIYRAEKGGENVGFVSVWDLGDFAFIEHFVTYEANRNKGYGSEVLKKLKENYKTLVLEAEPPKADMQKRRIAFYERNGFCQNPQKYIQPSYRRNGHGIELVLMSFPSKLCNFESAVQKIYSIAYETGEEI
jgi:ribosomal protein S18 acetylase RimI-like enzyme